MILTRVVLPEPLGPMTARKSPSLIVQIDADEDGRPVIRERDAAENNDVHGISGTPGRPGGWPGSLP